VYREDLVSDAGLQEFLLHHQTRINMLCCAQYHVLLTAQTGLTHVCSAAHTVPYARLSEDKYHNVCNELGIRTDYPTSQELDGIKALSGLDIYTMALICGVDRCSMIFASRGAMQKHYDMMHKGVPIPTIWHIVLAQRLDNGSHKTYFRVIEPSYVDGDKREFVLETRVTTNGKSESPRCFTVVH